MQEGEGGREEERGERREGQGGKVGEGRERGRERRDEERGTKRGRKKGRGEGQGRKGRGRETERRQARGIIIHFYRYKCGVRLHIFCAILTFLFGDGAENM